MTIEIDRKMQFYSLEEIINEEIGAIGTPKRDDFEDTLRFDLLGKAIKEARLQRNLTQQQLGELVGVQKAQISKPEKQPDRCAF